MARQSIPKPHPKAKGEIEVLVCAALGMLDCDDLTPLQRLRAEEIYDLAHQLEDTLQNSEEKEGQ